MSKVRNENFIVIQGWMITDLELKGNELIVFAIIHGFSQDGENCFSGNLQYLADWTRATKQGVLNNLKSLVKKGYITKEEKIINGVKFVEYRSTKFNGVLNKVDRGIKQSLMGGIKQSLTNNIDINNTEDNININSRFRKPTIDEVRAYCRERKNNVDAERFFDYYESNGWMVGRSKMKDWKAAVRTWERNAKARPATKRQELEDGYDMLREWAQEG